ncbi:MAG: pyridoxal phosphate-dependent aminotransferase [Vulcanimicrobiaceae bacterium]
MNTRAFHGGDLTAVAMQYGVREEDLVDFSTNVNPVGPPRGVGDVVRRFAEFPELFLRYPEPSSAKLRHRLAVDLGVQAKQIVVTNGAAAALDVAVRALSWQRCLLPVPAFSEYEPILRNAGVCVRHLILDDVFSFDDAGFERVMKGCDGVILTNPHNPSGRTLSRARLHKLIATCRNRRVQLLLDEAFVDYCPELSFVASASDDVVVVRSLTKFYGMPGLRIGYLVGGFAFCNRVAELLPSWPVGSLELEAACAALDDREYALTTRANNSQERELLAASLRVLGCRVFESAANFLCIEFLGVDLDVLFHRLVREFGIVVRDVRTYEGVVNRSLVRLGVRDSVANARLVAALRAVM